MDKHYIDKIFSEASKGVSRPAFKKEYWKEMEKMIASEELKSKSKNRKVILMTLVPVFVLGALFLTNELLQQNKLSLELVSETNFHSKNTINTFSFDDKKNNTDNHEGSLISKNKKAERNSQYLIAGSQDNKSRTPKLLASTKELNISSQENKLNDNSLFENSYAKEEEKIYIAENLKSRKFNNDIELDNTAAKESSFKLEDYRKNKFGYQRPEKNYSLYAGLGSSIYQDYNSNNVLQSKTFMLGVQRYYSDKFSLSVEAKWLSRKSDDAKLNFKLYNFNSFDYQIREVEYDYESFNFIQVPIQLNFHVFKGHSLNAGVYYNYLLYAHGDKFTRTNEIHSNEVKVEKQTNYFFDNSVLEEHQLGVSMGYSFRLNKQFELSAIYQRGMNKFLKHKAFNVSNSVNNDNLQVQLKFHFL